jgi:hypothetical protein
MAQSTLSRREEILAQLKAKNASIPESTTEQKLQVSAPIPFDRIADIDNLLNSINGSSGDNISGTKSRNLSSQPAAAMEDMTGAVTFYTSFGGGSIYPPSGGVIKLPYTTKDVAMIALIKSTYAIGSLTCPIKMKVLG